MFTGLVQDVGIVRSRREDAGGLVFRVESRIADELSEGESVAVDGACLTVAERADGAFRVEAIRTTVTRTTLAEYQPGRRVNLERALRAGDRLGGHLVQGHVDGVGEVVGLEEAGETVLVRIRLPEEVAGATVERGSVTVDGVSLTVSRLEGEVAEVAIIPYTWEHTAMDRLSEGARVNLEADMMGKYVQKLLRSYLDRAAPLDRGRQG